MSTEQALATAEAEHRDVAEGSETRAVQHARSALGGVLDEWNAMSNRERADSNHIGRIAVIVRDQNRVYTASQRCLDRLEVRRQRLWVDIVQCCVDVGEAYSTDQICA